MRRLIHLARRVGADAIFAGVHGRTAGTAPHALAGSAAAALLLHAP